MKLTIILAIAVAIAIVVVAFRRQAGWMILRELYPDLTAKVPDYNFRDSDETCKEKIGKIFPGA